MIRTLSVRIRIVSVILVAWLALVSAAGAFPSDESTLAGDRAVAPTVQPPTTVEVDAFTGAATWSLPLALPRGTGGLTPEIALRYSSAGPIDSWVGSRWTLSFPSIARSLGHGTPTYADGLDVFTFGGRELLPADDDPTLPRRYHTRRESFLRIVHQADGSWTVTTKDGTARRYGLTPEARIENGSGGVFEWLLSEQEDLHGNAFSVSWDRRDPGLAYPSEVRYGLRRTGASLRSLDGDAQRDRVVQFVLEPRPDVPESWLAGFRRHLGHRLGRIDVRIGSNLLRRYDLTYAGSPDSFRSLLVAVSLHGVDADGPHPTPPLRTAFSYHSNVESDTMGWELVPWNWPAGVPLVEVDRRDGGVRVGDVDGDGRPDLVKAFADVDVVARTAALTADSGVYLNTGFGFELAPSSQWPLPEASGPEAILDPFFAMRVDGQVWGSGRTLLDLTGDGRADIATGMKVLLADTGNLLPFLPWPWFENSPTGWVESPVTYDDPGGDPFYSLMDPYYSLAKLGLPSGLGSYLTLGGNARFADLTGDGLPELVVRGMDAWYRAAFPAFECVAAEAVSYVVLNEGGLEFRLPARETTTVEVSPPVPGLSGCSATLLHASEFAPCDPVADPTCGARLFHNRTFALEDGVPPWWYDVHRELGNLSVDLNADGLADAVTAYAQDGMSLREVRINDGRRAFVPAEAWSLPADLQAFDRSADLWSRDQGIRLADVNGDGRVDVVRAREGTTRITWLNDGDVGQIGDAGPWLVDSGWTSPVSVVDPAGLDEGVRFLDVDGDGMVDVLRSKGSEREVYLNRGAVPDLLVRVTSPLGSTTTLEYEPSTYFDNTGDDGIPDLPRVVQVLSARRIDDGGGNVSSTTFEYTEGRFDAETRELRGFGTVAQRDWDFDGATLLRESMTSYHQDEARAGLREAIEIRDGAGNLLAGAAWRYFDDDQAPFVTLPISELRLEWDGQTTARRKLTETEYDVFGNVVIIRELGEVDAAGYDLDPDDSRETIRVYGFPNLDRYLVDRVAVEALTDRSGHIIRETRFQYDGKALFAMPSTGDLTSLTRMLREVGRADPKTTFTWDEYGNLASVTDPRANAQEGGGTTTFEHDATLHALLVAQENALGHRTEYGYESSAECPVSHPAAAGLVHVERGPNALAAGHARIRCYDAFGRPTFDRAPADLAETLWVYGDDPGAAQILQSRRATDTGTQRLTIHRLDGLGRMLQTVTSGPGGQLVLTEREWDALGRLDRQTAPRFLGAPPRMTRFDYDALDRPIRTELPGGGRVHSIAYDRGRTIRTDPNGNLIERRANVFGNVVEVTEFVAAAPIVTRYRYDESSQLVQVTDAGGNELRIEYDRLGRRTGVEDPDAGTVTYQYDAGGNLLRRNGALGEVSWAYDALDRPTLRSTEGSNPTEVRWIWDHAENGIGLLKQRSDSAATYWVVEYDLLGRPTHERFTAAGTHHDFQTHYDPLGQVIERSFPNGRELAWRRGSGGFLQGIESAGGEILAGDLAWDARGRIRRWMSGGGVVSTSTYDDETGLLEEIEVAGSSALERLRYVFDPGDRVAAILDLRDSGLDRSFQYDELDRLVQATGPYAAGLLPGISLHYAYDALGNATCIAAPSPGPGCPGGTKLVYVLPGAGVPRPHAPIFAAGSPVTHDAFGNLSSWAGRGFAHDVLGQLTRISEGGVEKASFTYDGTGRLARIVTPTGARRLITPDFEWDESAGLARIHLQLAGRPLVTFEESYVPLPGRRCGLGWELALLVPMVLVLRRRGSRSWRAHLLVVSCGAAAIAGGASLLFEAEVHANLPSSTVWYHGDHLGSSVLVTDATGDVVERAVYRPFGAKVPETPDGSEEAPEFGFTGRREVAELGIYDYGARWYHPQLGRFLEPDALVPEPFDPQSLNPYSYVLNNPVNRIDPTGNFSVSGFFGGVGDVFASLGSAISGFGSALGHSLSFGAQPSGSGFFYRQGAGLGSIVGAAAGIGAAALATPFQIAADAVRWIPGIGGALSAPFSSIATGVGDYGRGVTQRADFFSRGVHRSLPSILADDLGATSTGLLANVTGLTGGASRTLAGAATLEGGTVQDGLSRFFAALVPRYGAIAGPSYGGEDAPFLFNNAIDILSQPHDVAYESRNPLVRAQADRELTNALVTSIVTDGPPQPGPYGQVYRVLEAGAFAVIGPLQSAWGALQTR